MASFSIKSFDKKLKEMSSRQDSVQTVSLWLIHHRAHSRTIVNLWLDRMKKGKIFVFYFEMLLGFARASICFETDDCIAL